MTFSPDALAIFVFDGLERDRQMAERAKNKNLDQYLRISAEDAQRDARQEAAKRSGVWPSRIILSAIVTLVGMQEMAGLSIPFGGSALQGSPIHPYQGDCFNGGSQHFTNAVEILQSAAPQSWQGAAADGHTAANQTLVAQANKMAELDLQMEQLVKDQAECVSQTQLGIGIEQNVLIVAYPTIYSLESNPSTFLTAMTMACATAAAAILAAMGQLGHCLDTSIQTQQAVNALAYEEVIAALQPVIDAYASAADRVLQSGQSGALDHAPHLDSEYASASAAISDTTAAFSPGSASSAGPQRGAFTVPTDERQRLGGGVPQPAATPDQGSPGPRVAQIRQPAGHTAHQLANPAAPPTRGNPHDQQAAPAKAARTGKDDHTEARATTQRAERAPIGPKATGPHQPPAATPAAA